MTLNTTKVRAPIKTNPIFKLLYGIFISLVIIFMYHVMQERSVKCTTTPRYASCITLLISTNLSKIYGITDSTSAKNSIVAAAVGLTSVPAPLNRTSKSCDSLHQKSPECKLFRIRAWRHHRLLGCSFISLLSLEEPNKLFLLAYHTYMRASILAYC